MAAGREEASLLRRDAQPIQFPIPYSGTWASVPAHLLPLDALSSSQNVYIRKGELRTRPGTGTLFSSTLINGSVVGGGIFSTASDTIPTIIGTDRVYRYSNGVWESIGSIPYNFALPIPSSSINTRWESGEDAEDIFLFATTASLWAWNGTGDISKVEIGSGGVSGIVDFEVFFDRVVAIVKPYSVRWCLGNDITQWSLLSDARKTEGGEVVAIKKLSSRSFALYKQRGIIVGFAQAGPESTALSFDNFRGEFEQPAGIHAIVDVGGVHYYLTPTGRVGRFDGTRQDWIADGVWEQLQDEIDPVYAYQTFAFYDNLAHVVGFCYPIEGQMIGLLLINLPRESVGVRSFAAFPGLLEKPLSYGFSYLPRFNSTKVLLFNPEDKRSYCFDELSETDGGKDFLCHIQTRLQGVDNLGINRFSGESYLERQDGYGGVTVKGIFSNTLGSYTGDVGSSAQVIDLNKEPVAENLAFTETGKFLGMRYDWGSGDIVRWKGAIIYPRRVS